MRRTDAKRRRSRRTTRTGNLRTRTAVERADESGFLAPSGAPDFRSIRALETEAAAPREPDPRDAWLRGAIERRDVPAELRYR